jgi:hypothetical protein
MSLENMWHPRAHGQLVDANPEEENAAWDLRENRVIADVLGGRVYVADTAPVRPIHHVGLYLPALTQCREFVGHVRYELVYTAGLDLKQTPGLPELK